jgi:hypothetical protein
VSANPAARGRGSIASALSGLAGWLVEPPEAAEPAADLALLRERPVVVVTGLHHRSGVTTVARALGAEFALRDPAGACAVTTEGGGSPSLGLPAAMRLARDVGPLGRGRTRACGRLCLVHGTEAAELCAAVRFIAPLVLDIADPAQAPAAVGFADGVVLVCGPSAEPSLAAVVGESLAAVGPAPAVALNRSVSEVGDWEGRYDLRLPDSRFSAYLAQSGREARGELGRAVRELAALVAR